ncbi:hypothetical protein GGI02_001446 [Coemansia sp. RSA 2322]|uniref:Ubiquitin carboxyl-terminal hydrolase n=1 Tax=Coemansia thaxteri TaxID=2663907 RepID=A0A9W8BK39_9FUNG|nr:hypothetical protein H4R26_001770 [Coemansia thaxteri]KAJ2472633.1 hypothetical protein GGI02_001446 [Coemansia sp. RSA 2322]KAJ2487063.1 hypothetical protein EV174_000745 [Coemansia sp. RSA 2320]
MSPGVTVYSGGHAASRVDKVLARQGKVDKVLLRRRIEFRLACMADGKMDQLRQKYRPINDVEALGAGKNKARKRTDDVASAGSVDVNGLVEGSGFRRAAHSLFPSERLSEGWRTMRPIGPGLNNLGNTCFLNSVLQCLTHTAPFAEYMLTSEHSRSCRAGDNCMLCKFESHVGRALSKRENSSISPKSIVGRLKLVAKHMRIGRQEDAHEFLRLLIDSFQRSLLHGIDPKIDRRIQETTLAHHLFGGYLQSQVKCSRCSHESNTFDPLLDLSLDIQAGNTVAKALRSFTRPEVLTKDNRYRCEKCSKLVEASKQMTIYSLPRILTLQLKRFSSFSGGKISRFVEFPLSLGMKNYVSENSPERGPYEYRLYAVLVHAGSTSRSGHYYSFVKSPAGVWYELNDDIVRQVSERVVLSQTAYLLFYERCQAKGEERPAAKQTPTVTSEPKAAGALGNGHSTNGSHQKSKNTHKNFSVAPLLGRDAAAASDDMEILLERKLKLAEPSTPVDKKKKKQKKNKHTGEQANCASDAAKQSHTSSHDSSSEKHIPKKLAGELEPPAEPRTVFAAVADVISAGLDTAAASSEWTVRAKPSHTAPGDGARVPPLTKSASAPHIIEWNETAASKCAKATRLAESRSAGQWSVADVRSSRSSQYGASIESWAGSASVADEAGASGSKDKAAKKRQRRPDMYDAEYDRGRTKKVKQKRNKFASSANPYQMLGERMSKK